MTLITCNYSYSVQVTPYTAICSLNLARACIIGFILLVLLQL